MKGVQTCQKYKLNNKHIKKSNTLQLYRKTLQIVRKFAGKRQGLQISLQFVRFFGKATVD